ncbi:TniQ family protein [Caballeronia sordidicola]|nr:TniQ family protein [Caballeronia sordidicola]
MNGINPGWLVASGAASSVSRGLGAAHWCPHCIADADGYWRVQWQTMDSACFQHQCWLSERCPGCDRQMTWRRARFDRCVCGYALTDVEAAPLSAEIKVLLGSEHPPELHELYLLSPAQRWNVASAIGALDIFGLRGKPFKKLSSKSPQRARVIMDRGAKILLFSGTCAFLHGLRVSRVSGDVPLVSEALPGLLNLLRKNLAPAELGWMLNLLDRYVRYAANQSSPIIWESKRTKRENGVNASSPLPKPRAKRIVHALSAQGITSQIRRTKSGRLKVTITDSDWMEVRRREYKLVGLRRVAKEYGLSVPRLRALIQAGLVRGGNARVDRDSLTSFATSIVERASPSDASALDRPIKLTEILRFRVPLSDTREFFDRISDGSIQIYWRMSGAKSFNALLIDATNFPSTLRRNDVHATHSIVESAELLGIKDEVMYHLVNVGLVVTSIERRNRRRARVIEAGELERFSRCTETLSAACRRQDVPVRIGITWARENGLKLVSGPTIDGGRQYFVRRTCDEPLSTSVPSFSAQREQR